MKRKVLAFVLRAGDCRLLAHEFADAPHVPWRLPGGGVETGEDPWAALLRELHEETGLTTARLLRPLGVQRYYKAFIQSEVERHDFLLTAPVSTPDIWEQQVGGSGEDAQEIFRLHWLAPTDLMCLDEEHRPFITSAYLPEFFA